MHVSYDPKLNIAYIRLRAKGAEVQAIKVSEDLVIDLAPDGSVRCLPRRRRSSHGPPLPGRRLE